MQTQITRRFFVKGAGLLSASAALAACSQDQGTDSTPAHEDASATGTTAPLLAIIHTNDTHGHDFEVPSTDDEAGNFSMAAVPALRKEYEDKGYDVLVLDAGDATQGMPLVDFSAGEDAITFMNSSGYDLMCLGNHEFDHGDEQIKKYEELAQFPLISANIRLKETGELRFAPNKLFDLMDGTKVGVFGLTTPETLKTARPDNVEEFSILTDDELFACAQEQVDELRKRGADIVVCLAHLGNEEMLVPNTSREVLSHVKGIDLFIDGHDHLLVEDQVEGTLLVETGCHFANIGLVIIDSGVPANESIAYGDYDGIDTATQSIIDEVHVRVDEELNVVLASTPFRLSADRQQARREEANLGDLHADAMVYDAEQATGQHVDGALLNAAALRASIDAGDITLEKVKRVLPYSNQVCVLKVSGAELLEVIEVGCAVVGTGEEMKSFPQVSGIEFSVNATVPFEKGEPYPDSIYCAPAAPGSRVTIHTVGGADFDEDATYAIAVTDFMAQGGDTFYPFKLAAEKEEPVTCDFDYEALVGYLIGPLDHEVDERYREPQGRITIIEG